MRRILARLTRSAQPADAFDHCGTGRTAAALLHFTTRSEVVVHGLWWYEPTTGLGTARAAAGATGARVRGAGRGAERGS